MKYFFLTLWFLGSLLLSFQTHAQNIQCQEFFQLNRFVRLWIFTTPPNKQDIEYSQRQLDGRLFYRTDNGDQNLKIDRTNIDQYAKVNYAAYSQENMTVANFDSVDDIPDGFVIDFRNLTLTTGNPLCRCEFKKAQNIPVKCGYGS